MTSTTRLLAFGAAVVIAVVVVVVVAVDRNEGIPELNRGGEPLPVILVHGYGGTPSSLATIEQRLRAEGRDVVSVALPDGGTGDILASARVVDEAVRATGSDVVDVIGFSMGGVVARAYVAELGGAAHTRYVMTLASPHHGTKIAGFAVIADPSACTGACEQLAPDSAFLDDLNEPDETPEGPAFVTVWTDKDETVTPPESAELDGALNIRIQDVCPDAPIAHGEVARHPLVLGLIVETLSGRLADVPAPDQCDALTTLGGAA